MPWILALTLAIQMTQSHEHSVALRLYADNGTPVSGNQHEVHVDLSIGRRPSSRFRVRLPYDSTEGVYWFHPEEAVKSRPWTHAVISVKGFDAQAWETPLANSEVTLMRRQWRRLEIVDAWRQFPDLRTWAMQARCLDRGKENWIASTGMRDQGTVSLRFPGKYEITWREIRKGPRRSPTIIREILTLEESPNLTTLFYPGLERWINESYPPKIRRAPGVTVPPGAGAPATPASYTTAPKSWKEWADRAHLRGGPHAPSRPSTPADPTVPTAPPAPRKPSTPAVPEPPEAPR